MERRGCYGEGLSERTERRRYFVTGTDTGVGKTFVTCALARRARALGSRVFAFKPIETGVVGDIGEDQKALAEAAGDWQQGEARSLYRFAMPAAPSVAADAIDETIDLGNIRRVYKAHADEVDVVLVEGAGGIRVPVTATLDMAGLARSLDNVADLELLIVGRAGLGTINHTLLTIEAAERDGLTVAAVVLSRRPDDDEAFARSNAEEIRRRWDGGVMILGPDETVLDALL